MPNQKAYIRLVEGSKQNTITLDEVKNLFENYKEMMKKTGTQLNWNYTAHAFPYEISETPDGKGKWFYLKANKNEDKYKYIVFAVGKKEQKIADDEVKTEYYIQVELPDGATYGDKGKANQYCKFLGNKLGAEVQLFNGRIMYFNKKK